MWFSQSYARLRDENLFRQKRQSAGLLHASDDWDDTVNEDNLESKEDDALEDYVGQTSDFTSAQSRKFYFIGFATLVALLLAGSGFALFYRNISRGPNVIDICGHTPEEARSAGCVFELFSWQWVPRECFHQELHDEFVELTRNHSYSFYADQLANKEIPLDTLLLGNDDVIYNSWEHHMWHCAFMWKRLSAAVIDGQPMIPGWTMSKMHTLHCVKNLVLKSHLKPQALNSVIHVRYEKCVNIRD